jgi:hypothetical protein
MALGGDSESSAVSSSIAPPMQSRKDARTRQFATQILSDCGARALTPRVLPGQTATFELCRKWMLNDRALPQMR